MENFEHASEVDKNLLQELKEKKPNRNVVFTAIEELEDLEQIKLFFGQYVESLKEYPQEESPEDIAKHNISYIVGYYDKETADPWLEALSDVIDPVFSRDMQFSE